MGRIMDRKAEIQSPEIRVKIIGAGGGGISALERLVEDSVTNLELIAIDTAAKSLRYAQKYGAKTIQIGKAVTNDYGTGGNPELGERAAREDSEAIREALRETDIVFITAGLGGGAGTGALPVIAEIIKEMGILCVGIVTLPFSFEGGKRQRTAAEGLAKIKDNLDALIVIENDRLLTPTIVKMSIEAAFRQADSVLRQGIQLIFELILDIGDINTDFADIRTMLRSSNKSDALLGIGESETGSVIEAVQKTINSPFFNRSLKGAKAIIFNVTAGENLELIAVQEAMDYLRKQTQNEDTDIFFGTVIDNEMGEKVRTMLIASDFE
jgi:cell division protein FtsZ